MKCISRRVLARVGGTAVFSLTVAFFCSAAWAVDIGFEEPEYTTSAGHENDGGLAGQGDNVGNPGCGGTEIGCWQNIFSPDGLTVTASAAGFSGQVLASEAGVNVFGPHIYQTDDTLLGGTFDSATSVLDYSFLYRMDTIGSGFNDAFQFQVTGASDHNEHVMKLGIQDHGGMYIEHGGTSDSGDGRTYLAKIGEPGTPLSPGINAINGKIDYASQSFTVNINGTGYSYESSTVTDNGGNYAFDDTSTEALAGGNIILLAANHAPDADATYTIDDLSLAIAAATPGDRDGDDDVDGADFLDWQRNDGTAAGLALVEENFGTGVGPLVGVAVIPEPSTLVLLCGVAAFGLTPRRHC